MKKHEMRITDWSFTKLIAGTSCTVILNTPKYYDDEVIEAWDNDEDEAEVGEKLTKQYFCESIPWGVDVIASYELRLDFVNPWISVENMHSKTFSDDDRQFIERTLTGLYNTCRIRAKIEIQTQKQMEGQA